MKKLGKTLFAVVWTLAIAACASTEKPTAGPQLYQQIRSEAKILIQDLKYKGSEDIQKAVEGRQFMNLGFVFAIDAGSGAILAHPNVKILGTKITEIYDQEYWKEILSQKESIFILNSAKGPNCYYFYRDSLKNIILGFSMPVKVVMGKYSL